MIYTCMSFGWYHELLKETQVSSFAAAERKLLEMLDGGGMIVHAYRETDRDTPEIVGRHGRLRAFMTDTATERAREASAFPHELERFLLDAASARAWVRASETGQVLDERWSVVELWPPAGHNQQYMYGKAMLVRA